MERFRSQQDFTDYLNTVNSNHSFDHCGVCNVCKSGQKELPAGYMQGERAVYLQKELIDFEQSGCLRTELDETVKRAVDRYNEKYLMLLNSAFVDPQYGEKQEKKERFRTLVEEWQSIM